MLKIIFQHYRKFTRNLLKFILQSIMKIVMIEIKENKNLTTELIARKCAIV